MSDGAVSNCSLITRLVAFFGRNVRPWHLRMPDYLQLPAINRDARLY